MVQWCFSRNESREWYVFSHNSYKYPVSFNHVSVVAMPRSPPLVLKTMAEPHLGQFIKPEQTK